MQLKQSYRMLVILLLFVCSPAYAATTAQKCQAAKNNAAGQYAECRQRAEKKLVTDGNVASHAAALAKCDANIAQAWAAANRLAALAGATCPELPHTLNDFKNVISDHTDNVAGGLAGGSLATTGGPCEEPRVEFLLNGYPTTAVNASLATPYLLNGVQRRPKVFNFGTVVSDDNTVVTFRVLSRPGIGGGFSGVTVTPPITAGPDFITGPLGQLIGLLFTPALPGDYVLEISAPGATPTNLVIHSG